MINPLCIKLFSGKQISRTWVEIVFSVNIAVNYFSGFTVSECFECWDGIT